MPLCILTTAYEKTRSREKISHFCLVKMTSTREQAGRRRQGERESGVWGLRPQGLRTPHSEASRANRPGGTRVWGVGAQPPPSTKKSSEEEHRVDAQAPYAEEGRGQLRKATRSRKQTLIRGYPNGETRRESCPVTHG